MRTAPLLAWLLLLAGDAAAQTPRPGDWPSWRGPEQNGVSRETGLIDEWDLKKGTNLLWRSEDLATRSTPVIMDGKIYTLARHLPDTEAEAEKVICADAATGEVLWEHVFNVFLSDVPAERVAWGACVADPESNQVYAMGVCGYFVCLDGATGEPVWTRSLSEEFGLLSTYGGRTNTPVVFEDLVIISAVTIGWGETARPTHRFMAFDKNSGELVWINGTRPLPDDTTYSTPVIAMLGDQMAMVFGSGDGSVWALQPRTGQPIWQYRLSLRGLNTSPAIVGDTVYIGQSEENIGGDSSMGAMVSIDGTGTGDITDTATNWIVKELMVGKSSPLYVDGKLFVVDDSAGMYVLDAATGEQIGKRQKLGTMMRSSLLWADGKIYACDVNGRWYILEFKDDELEVIHKLRLPSTDECHGAPIVSSGRVYLPTTGAMYCLGNADTQPNYGEIPAPRPEHPVSEDETPAFAQLIPAEEMLLPGEQVNYRVRLFNSRGQLVQDNAPAEFSVEGPGATIDSSGVLSTETNSEHRAVTVTAQVGDLTATSRVRVIPDFPWAFDFSDGEVPITWVGARYRHVPREVDGEAMIVKISTIPKGTRSQAWMGRPEASNYTIQADVRSTAQAGEDKDLTKIPDIGLIAQRYTLDMMGTRQQLQIRSWTSQLGRFSHSVPFEWEPGKWYTLKFSATAGDDGSATLRGKAWPRGEPEPSEWQIEATDKAGNLIGSPGLFGNATSAEIFIDNVKVTQD